ncbi:beta/gamma crystallin-related protein [Mangrovimonas aestuarii]|uniref:beta/gamma crystallin-related protein n=1 Tax=Mangrovimonas aestuarii TaxID=3018443 RepID=UPI00237959E6|nr:beta/gamma crystallin-related protein [Mangrovimonas aestuarii]
MSTNKLIAVIAFILLSTSTFGQQRAYNLDEIVDMRGGSAEEVLKDKGYRLEKVDKSTSGIYQNWWNSRRNECVTVKLVDGRVRSVVKSPDFDCDKDRSSSHNSHGYGDDVRLSDLSGMSESRASSMLQDKNYRVTKTGGNSNLTSLYWYRSRDNRCLIMFVKNDRVTSVTKTSTSLCQGSSHNDRRDDNYHSGRHYNSDHGVTLYKDCGFKGGSNKLGVGRYNYDELGIGNDNLSSIRVPRGYKITLYRESNFEGRSKTYYDDVSCLSDDDWNDRTSSIKVSRD